jgi:hypothetical protein
MGLSELMAGVEPLPWNGVWRCKLPAAQAPATRCFLKRV